MKTRLATAAAIAAMSIFGSNAVFAQQPTQQPAPVEGQGREHGMRGPRGPQGAKRGMWAFERLDLTDAQRQQIRQIADRFRESTKSQREQMRAFHDQMRQGTLSADDQARLKDLRNQMRALEQQRQAEMLTILTPEQRAKLEEMKEQFQREHPRPRSGRRSGGPGEQAPAPTQSNQ